MKTIIILSNGTEISSGQDVVPNIRRCKINAMVNDGQGLRFGSVCSSYVELTIFCPGEELRITAGMQFQLYKQDSGGNRTKIGVFNAEKPTKSSANLYKITAYDNVIKLDKDMTFFLQKRINQIATSDPLFAGPDAFVWRICEYCGLTYKKDTDVPLPNEQLAIPQFTPDGQTGRLLMQWIGECTGRFFRANADGEIELARYDYKNIDIRPDGEHYYFQGSFRYEDYEVPEIDGLNFWWINCWKQSNPEAKNPYTVPRSNLIWSGRGGRADSWEQNYWLQEEELFNVITSIGPYTPGKLTIPVRLDIRPGDIIRVYTQEGRMLFMLVTSAVMDGQRMTLESTGIANSCGAVVSGGSVAGDGVSETSILSALGAEWVTIDGRYVLAKKETV